MTNISWITSKGHNQPVPSLTLIVQSSQWSWSCTRSSGKFDTNIFLVQIYSYNLAADLQWPRMTITTRRCGQRGGVSSLARVWFFIFFIFGPCQLLSRWRLSLIIFPPRSAAFSFACSWIICVCALLLADSCAVASQSVFQIRWIMNKALQQKSLVPREPCRGGASWAPSGNFKFNSHIHRSIRLFTPRLHALINWAALFLRHQSSLCRYLLPQSPWNPSNLREKCWTRAARANTRLLLQHIHNRSAHPRGGDCIYAASSPCQQYNTQY